MDVFQKQLDRSLSTVPQRFLANLIAKKLRTQGIKVRKSVPDKIAEHVLAGNGKPFKYGAGSPSRNITLTLTESDVSELGTALEKFLDTGIEKFIPDLAGRLAKDLVKHLRSRWEEEHALQATEVFLFRERPEERWGEALNGLRILLTCVREWGGSAYARRQSAGHAKALWHEILLRLHVRACQVTDEIICLLENGFADGAMARWRTLHELAVVATVIHQHGEEIAERYHAHQAVESKRAMRKYASCYALLGQRPLSSREVSRIDKAYNAAISKYGKDFDSDYGWAIYHLKKRKVTFADLAQEAGRADMRSYYQMGNDNVHAGIKSLFVRLGLVDNYKRLLAGRSNTGLADPGQNTAHTLMQISVLVCLSEPVLDDIVAAETIRLLRDDVVRSFFRAHQRLRRDDKRSKRSGEKATA